MTGRRGRGFGNDNDLGERIKYGLYELQINLIDKGEYEKCKLTGSFSVQSYLATGK